MSELATNSSLSFFWFSDYNTWIKWRKALPIELTDPPPLKLQQLWVAKFKWCQMPNFVLILVRTQKQFKLDWDHIQPDSKQELIYKLSLHLSNPNSQSWLAMCWMSMFWANQFFLVFQQLDFFKDYSSEIWPNLYHQMLSSKLIKNLYSPLVKYPKHCMWDQ